MIKSLWIRLLDWVSYKLDQSVVRIMERDLGKDVPASPGPKTGRLPDGCFAPGTRIVYEFIPTTPDRPTDPIRREIEALTGKADASHYPKGS